MPSNSLIAFNKNNTSFTYIQNSSNGNETATTQAQNTLPSSSNRKMTEEQRRIDEEMLSVELLHNFRKINKQMEQERNSKISFNESTLILITYQKIQLISS
jgi:hypothetical protein